MAGSRVRVLCSCSSHREDGLEDDEWLHAPEVEVRADDAEEEWLRKDRPDLQRHGEVGETAATTQVGTRQGPGRGQAGARQGSGWGRC